MLGETLAHYEILEKVGSGGMGDVYRARDTKLHRDVAIKLLSEKLAPNPERLARFEREAHLLASLNHPNIATIHGLEQDGGVDFIVLELVEGETLAERIARGPMPLDQVLAIFEQIAHGLQAAHDKGIVHRDLKPPNIKITPDGHVKILDFGLGKVFEDTEAEQLDPSLSPTLTRDGSRTGVILGTPAYMSPEQARAEPVDKRADIWAFGACLYEALTGRPAFAGTSAMDILASVMRAEPDWERLPQHTPFFVRRAIRRCLDKDASQRFHDIADVRIDLCEATTDPLAHEVTHRPNRLQFVLWGLVMLAAGAVVWSVVDRPSLNLPVTRTEIETGPLYVFTQNVAYSRDGKKLAYASNEDDSIFVRNMDGDVPVKVPDTLYAGKPVFSPDGEWLAFHDGSKLKKARSTGGAAVTLTDWGVGTGFGSDWESEDTIVFADVDGIYRVSANGGERQRLDVKPMSSEKVLERPRHPDVLPGGRAILMTAGPFGGGAEFAALHDVLTGERRILIEHAYGSRYVPTGHIVFMRDDTLQAVRFDLDELAVEGEPVPVFENIHVTTNNGSAHYAFSDTGSLAYVPAQWDGYRRSLVWVDHEGNVEPIRSFPRRVGGAHVAPDGESIVLSIADRTHVGLWLTEASRETLSPLLPREWAYAPRWSPDGERLAFVGMSSDGFALFVTSITQVREPQLLGPGANNVAWSPDGSVLVYQVMGEESIFDLWTVELEGEPTPKPYLEESWLEGNADFSPDGRWLAYVSNESGRGQVYVQPFGRAGLKHQISTDGGQEPIWSPDGTEIYYRSRRKMMAVTIQTEPTYRASAPRTLFEGDFLRSDFNPWVRNHSLSPDGTRFLMIQSEAEPVYSKINIVLNWFEELKRLVPVDE